MARLYPVNTYQLTLNLLQGTQVAAIVLGVKSSTGVLTATDAAALRDAAWAAFRPLIASSTTCTGATLRATSAASGGVVEVGAPPTPGGGDTGNTGVASGCTLIKWATDTGGRSGKGRTYLPGLTQGAVGTDGRTYTAAHITKVQTAIAAYTGASVFASALKPAVLSFTKGTAAVITSGAPSAIVGLQRRRMR